MRDEAHVGLVDPHAERDGRDHHDAVVAEEPRLVRRAHRGVEPGVIRQRVDALRAQELGRLLDRLAAQRVHDARRARGLRADEREQLPARVDLRLDAVLDVRPVEARDEVLRASGRRSRSVISRWVASVAVAVSATRGTPGNCVARSPSVR